MNILLIPDKFKESLTADGVIKALKKGILKSQPGAHISSLIASDGGDGFLGAVSEYVKCKKIITKTEDPLGRMLNTYFLYDPENRIAFIELAKTAGLELLTEKEKSPMTTSTFGTGIQIGQAIEKGATTIYVGLGGSATNDGGMGMAAALGYEFKDASGKLLSPEGGNLKKIASIHTTAKVHDIDPISVIAVNDVENPLFGTNGAAYIYAKQKGASLEEIKTLDSGLRNLDAKVNQHLKKSNALDPGSGAAGGMGYGITTFLNGKATSGIDFIMKLAKVESILAGRSYDYIITGEGKFDAQTLNGKLINGVVKLGRHHNIPIIVVCGQSDIQIDRSSTLGLHAIIEIMDRSKPLTYNMQNAAILIERKIRDYFKRTIH